MHVGPKEKQPIKEREPLKVKEGIEAYVMALQRLQMVS